MMLLSHTITYDDKGWTLVFTIEQSDIVPQKCLLTRNGKFVDVCTTNDFKHEIILDRVNTVSITKSTFDEVYTLKSDMIKRISNLKDEFESLMLDLRDSSKTWLKL